MTASSCNMPAATSCSCRSKTSSFCRATARKTTEAQLDKLGGGAWQARKAKLKKRILEIADG
jgi:transcription-repair coupling factor (superfamily II helicase)